MIPKLGKWHGIREVRVIFDPNIWWAPYVIEVKHPFLWFALWKAEGRCDTLGEARKVADIWADPQIRGESPDNKKGQHLYYTNEEVYRTRKEI